MPCKYDVVDHPYHDADRNCLPSMPLGQFYILSSVPPKPPLERKTYSSSLPSSETSVVVVFWMNVLRSSSSRLASTISGGPLPLLVNVDSNGSRTNQDQFPSTGES